MAVRNTKLDSGSTNYIDGEVLFAADHNDTNDAILDREDERSRTSLVANGRNLIRQLQDRSVVFSADGGEWAEAYTSAGGRLSSFTELVDNYGSSYITTDGAYYNYKKYDCFESSYSDRNDFNLGSGSINQYMAFPFYAIDDYDLSRVDLNVRRRVGNGQNLTIKIFSDNAYKPNVSLGASETRTAADFSTTQSYDNWYSFNFATPVSLTKGTRYWLVMSCAGNNASHYLQITRSDYASIRQVNGFASSDESTWTKTGNSPYIFGVAFKTFEFTGESEILHTIPTNTLSSDLSKCFFTSLLKSYESDNKVQYKLTYGDLNSSVTSISDSKELSSLVPAVSIGNTFYGIYYCYRGRVAEVDGYVKGNNDSNDAKIIVVFLYADGSLGNADAGESTTTYTKVTVTNPSPDKDLNAIFIIVSSGNTSATIGYLKDVSATISRAHLPTLEQTDWLDWNKINSFTPFGNPSTDLHIKLKNENTSPTAGYPAIYGFGLHEVK